MRKHINNVFNENELEKDNNTQKMRVDGIEQKGSFYTIAILLACCVVFSGMYF